MTEIETATLGGPSAALQLAEIARRFYLGGQSKQDIAAGLGLTRFKVARLIEQAREAGVVRIEITSPQPIDAELSEELAAAYHLRHAIVLTVPDQPEADLRRQLAKVAAALLSEIVTDHDVLGIGYGRTLNATTAALTQLARCTTVQLTGALLGVQVSENSIELVRRVAAITGGPAYPLYTPQVLPDPGTAHTLRQQLQVAQAYQRFDHITKAVIAVGSWEPPHSQLYEALSDPERAGFRDLGVTAEVCATLLDAHGNQVAADFTNRCIAITGTQLQAIPDVIAVAGGTTKLNAIQAVLHGGYANSLITNHTVARGLLEYPTHPRAAPAGPR
ncbi:sugar-binding transcriptional regulator [Jatrophihabitans lederbergiae]|uniref:Sugar-binding domain-containing protein n=1 Tax=Jatrophihabitans lederbergiae TaxID=3075547 RepID=A0ABU2JFN1_9ACTN|nr:sugar-binding domain-containing protein [Jatrophihabitans sp. DSM 44399]MDT0263786.1 sugar-binding domain-containing protein [Jatrophihabitans sp. DSM 44399]